MSHMVKPALIRTLPVVSFSNADQRAFVAVCQHIDFLFQQTGELFHRIAYSGSDSWIAGHDRHEEKVLIKALPWDHRIKVLESESKEATSGVAVLLRDDGLEKKSMRAIWDIYGMAYRPYPPNPLFNVVPQPGKDFQLLIFGLGTNGCDFTALPGVDLAPDILRDRLENRSSDGVKVYGRPSIGLIDAANPVNSPQISSSNSSIVATIGQAMTVLANSSVPGRDDKDVA